MGSIKLDYRNRCGGEPEKGPNRWNHNIPTVGEADEGGRYPQLRGFPLAAPRYLHLVNLRPLEG